MVAGGLMLLDKQDVVAATYTEPYSRGSPAASTQVALAEERVARQDPPAPVEAGAERGGDGQFRLHLVGGTPNLLLCQDDARVMAVGREGMDGAAAVVAKARRPRWTLPSLAAPCSPRRWGGGSATAKEWLTAAERAAGSSARKSRCSVDWWGVVPSRKPSACNKASRWRAPHWAMARTER